MNSSVRTGDGGAGSAAGSGSGSNSGSGVGGGGSWGASTGRRRLRQPSQPANNAATPKPPAHAPGAGWAEVCRAGGVTNGRRGAMGAGLAAAGTGAAAGMGAAVGFIRAGWGAGAAWAGALVFWGFGGFEGLAACAEGLGDTVFAEGNSENAGLVMSILSEDDPVAVPAGEVLIAGAGAAGLGIAGLGIAGEGEGDAVWPLAAAAAMAHNTTAAPHLIRRAAP